MKLKFLGKQKLIIMGMKFVPGEEYTEQRENVVKELMKSRMFEKVEIPVKKPAIKKAVKEE